MHYVDSKGKTHLVDKGLAYPNGIVLVPGGKLLYVGESKHNRVLAYDVVAPGKVANRRVLADLPAKDAAAGQIDNQPDGMCLDAAGNLYVAHYGMKQVQVLGPDGKLLARYPGGNLTTSNVAFGGPKMDQLFVTGGLGAVSGSGRAVPARPGREGTGDLAGEEVKMRGIASVCGYRVTTIILRIVNLQRKLLLRRGLTYSSLTQVWLTDSMRAANVSWHGLRPGKTSGDVPITLDDCKRTIRVEQRFCDMAESNRTSLVLLAEQSDDQALVKLNDGDVFFVAVADAARACSAFDKARDFSVQFARLLETLARWIDSRRERMKSAHLTIRERDILFVVMQKSVQFDGELADALTELDLLIANSPEFQLIDLDVMALPAVSPDSAKAFLSSGEIYTYAK